MHNVNNIDYEIKIANNHVNIEVIDSVKLKTKGFPIFKESIDIVDRIDCAKNLLMSKIFNDLENLRRQDILVNGDILKVITYVEGKILTLEAFIILKNDKSLIQKIDKKVASLNTNNTTKEYFKNNNSTTKEKFSDGISMFTKAFFDNSKDKQLDFKLIFDNSTINIESMKSIKEEKKFLIYKIKIPTFYLNEQVKLVLFKKSMRSLVELYKKGLIDTEDKVRFDIKIEDGHLHFNLFLLNKELTGFKYHKHTDSVELSDLSGYKKQITKYLMNKYNENDKKHNTNNTHIDYGSENISIDKIIDYEHNINYFAKNKIKSLHEQINDLMDNEMFVEANEIVSQIDLIRREFFINKDN